MAHHPLNSASGKSEERRGGVKGWLLKTFFCNQFDLWISAHAHHLEHTALPGCSSQAIIAGAGGGEQYPIQNLANASESFFLKEGYGFYQIDVDSGGLTHRFFNERNEEIYVNHHKRESARE